MIFRISIWCFDKQALLSYLLIYHLDFRIKGTLIFIFLALVSSFKKTAHDLWQNFQLDSIQIVVHLFLDPFEFEQKILIYIILVSFRDRNFLKTRLVSRNRFLNSSKPVKRQDLVSMSTTVFYINFLNN
jgi:hypothetical protein